MSATNRSVPLILLLALAMGCGESETSSAADDSPLGVVEAATYGELPFCWFGRRAQVFYVVSTDEFFYCDGRRFVELDLGDSGSGGTAWVVNVAPASLTECPNGGALIISGPDENGDGVVDSVASSQSVCDGVDGTSCTVARDDAAGLTTITCEDGTVATVADGADGSQGADGAPGDDGAPGADGSPGADGTSCSVETGPGGEVTIACDDGTSATVPAGSGSDGDDLLCELVRINPSVFSFAELASRCPQAESCPCWTEESILNKIELDPASVTGCVTYERNNRYVTETVPGANGANAAFEVSDAGAGATFDYICDTDESTIVPLTYQEFNTCITILADTVGPCEPAECLFDSACEDDGNSCTDVSCDTTTFSCVSVPKAPGSSCDLPGGGPGQCAFGRCQPVVSP